VPLSWRYFQMGSLAFVTKLAGFEYTKNMASVLSDTGEVPVIRAQNVRPFRPGLRNLKFIDLQTSITLQRCALDKPCLLMTFIGAGIGDTCIFNENIRWHLAPNVAKIEPFADLCLDYLAIYLNASVGRDEIFKSMKSTAQPSLSMTTIREIWISIPPLPEQYRIAAEVDKLMALCDSLKERLNEVQTTQLHLTVAIVESSL
jgi:type I restriction enzyme S subunit